MYSISQQIFFDVSSSACTTLMFSVCSLPLGKRTKTDEEVGKSVNVIEILNSLERDELISIIQRSAKEKAFLSIELQDAQSRLRRVENRNKILQQNVTIFENENRALAEDKDWWKEQVTSRSCTCGLFNTTINDLPGETLINILQHVDVSQHGILRT